MWYTTEPNIFFQPDIFLMQCEPMTILPDRSDLVIEQVSMTNEVTIAVCAASPAAPCPCCGTISKQIQSRYTRTLRDLPESRTSCTSGYSRAPLLLSREYMRAQNLCRTLSFSHVATCQIHLALARGAPRYGLCTGRGGGRTLGQEPELSWQLRYHFAPGQTSRTAYSLIPTRGGAG